MRPCSKPRSRHGQLGMGPADRMTIVHSPYGRYRHGRSRRPRIFIGRVRWRTGRDKADHRFIAKSLTADQENSTLRTTTRSGFHRVFVASHQAPRQSNEISSRMFRMGISMAMAASRARASWFTPELAIRDCRSSGRLPELSATCGYLPDGNGLVVTSKMDVNACRFILHGRPRIVVTDRDNRRDYRARCTSSAAVVMQRHAPFLATTHYIR